MTDKPALSWYPTTIEELQRLLDSGVWPRGDTLEARIDAVVQTFVEFLEQRPSPALSWYPTTIEELQRLLDSGVWPRGDTLEARIDAVVQTFVEFLEQRPSLAPIIKEPELDMPPSVAGVDFCVVELDGGGWRMEASCDDPEGPLGPECVVRGEEHDSKAEAVVGAWEFAFGLRTNQLDIALEQSTRPSDVEVEVHRLADYLLRHHMSEWCSGPDGAHARAVDVAIHLLRSAGEDRRRLAAALTDRSELQRMMSDADDGLRKIAAASGMIVDAAQPAHVYVNALAERVEKQLALRGPVLRTEEDEQNRAALDRLTAYMRINHAHTLSSGEHVADVATWALAKEADVLQPNIEACEALQRIARAVGLNRYADDIFTIIKAANTIAGRVELRLSRHGEALERIAVASGYQMLQGLTAADYDSSLAERVEQQFADFRKVADRLGTDREIAGAAEQLVRRLVDRLVETDPEYIEQLRRSGS